MDNPLHIYMKVWIIPLTIVAQTFQKIFSILLTISYSWYIMYIAPLLLFSIKEKAYVKLQRHEIRGHS